MGSLFSCLLRAVWRRLICASNAKKKIVKSPIGEALIKFPAIVAILRIGVEETNFA